MTKISLPTFGGEGSKVILPRKGRKPLSNFYQEPDSAPAFEPSMQGWKEIESAYGREFPDALRAQIKEIVDDYLWFSSCERNKSYADEAIKYLEMIAKTSFPPIALAKAPRKPAHKETRDVLLEGYLFDEASPDESAAANFVTTPNRITSAARAMVNDLRAYDMAPNKKKPVEWDKMAVRLMIALRSCGLPYTVNKRGTKKGASPVVALLHEFQDRLPEECRLHIGRDGEATDETMAAAASAAWSAYKGSREGNHDLRELAKFEKAKCEGRDYKILERHERLNKVFKYLAFRRRRSLFASSAVAAATEMPS